MDTYSVSVDPSLADAGWPLRLRQHDDGSIFVTDLDLLKERELAAARDCKYRLAAQLYVELSASEASTDDRRGQPH